MLWKFATRLFQKNRKNLFPVFILIGISCHLVVTVIAEKGGSSANKEEAQPSRSQDSICKFYGTRWSIWKCWSILITFWHSVAHFAVLFEAIGIYRNPEQQKEENQNRFRLLLDRSALERHRQVRVKQRQIFQRLCRFWCPPNLERYAEPRDEPGIGEYLLVEFFRLVIFLGVYGDIWSLDRLSGDVVSEQISDCFLNKFYLLKFKAINQSEKTHTISTMSLASQMRRSRALSEVMMFYRLLSLYDAFVFRCLSPRTSASRSSLQSLLSKCSITHNLNCTCCARVRDENWFVGITNPELNRRSNDPVKDGLWRCRRWVDHEGTPKQLSRSCCRSWIKWSIWDFLWGNIFWRSIKESDVPADPPKHNESKELDE